MRTILILAVAISTVFFSVGASAGTWYVDASVPKAGDGTSWQKALKKIQSGIEKAANGDTLIVAQGTYVENVNFKGKSVVLRSTNPTDWTVVKRTIIDGNQAGSVVTFAGTENETCILSGFTIQNGSGTWTEGFPGYESFAGGGIFGGVMGTRTHATIQNNLITGNSSEDAAGIFRSDGLIQNNLIVANSAGTTGEHWHGGGIEACNGVVQNNVIAGNIAGCGGALSFCNAVFRNNIVVGNHSSGHGGGLAHLGTSPFAPLGGSITNCIIWGNSSPIGPQVVECILPTYCCIQDWTGGGEGNIARDPQFADPDGPDNNPATYEDNDYHLLPASPCIDRGKNEDWMATAFDLDGNPRILGGAWSLTVDMGAYEYRFSIGGIRIVPGTGAPELSWNSRQKVRYGVWSCTNLAAALWNAEAEVPAGKEMTIWTDPDTTSTLKFYRIELK